ncbi:hypothetical protein TR13x_00445 [Caloranaerobacter sp. TR13]|uniref:CdaR family transcriptional regulator n=1 Tax=Caloranaerobacter sp. TR13 TaxID=1302151 RepID=UPI0006D3CB14|nr:sugar diacid recognition domain-containing protein [Caloranaerobacter sp. TR13]KPU27864.1 hypothetical protein TR13x_00445 [Caloranaerobacter sp. TR13]
MKLNYELAQKIVDKTMDVLGKNINIMNNQGIIIASGDSERINTFHEVAFNVIKEKKPIKIMKQETYLYKGVKSGINLPIYFHGNIIGVVGITGEVSEVSSYGELVKNFVELMLQQEFLNKQIELENRTRENFYQQLLSNSIEDKEVIKDRAELLKIKTGIYRGVILVKPTIDNCKTLTNKILMLYDYLDFKEDDCVFIRGEFIVIIKAFKSDDADSVNSLILEIAKSLEKELVKRNYKPFFGIGQPLKGLEKLYLSYQSAKYALKVGEKLSYVYKNRIYYINQLNYDFFLPLIDKNIMSYYIKHLANINLNEIFSEKEIGHTIEALIENDLNISKTAKKLFIHRNTLLYRLDRIKKMTGLNPKKAKDLFILLWAYHIYLYLK